MTPSANYPLTLNQLALFPVYASRAAAESAGLTVPAFNASLPIKPWVDPNGAAGGTYNVFDSTSPSTGYIVQLTVPKSSAALNLPGGDTYSAYVALPTDALEYSPFGLVGPVSPDTVCLEADAQALATLFTALYGQTVSVVDHTASGVYRVVYGTDPRRQWGFQVAGGPSFSYAQSFIEAQAMHGVGAPGHWALTSNNGKPATMIPTWIQDFPPTTPQPGELTAPTPIRALLPGEAIQPTPGQFPGSNEFQVVDLAAQITAIEAQIAQLQATLAQLQAQA